MHSDHSTVRRASARPALGVLQMSVAVTSLVLLFETGLTRAAMVAVVCTCVLTTISVVLFGRGRQPGPQRGQSSETDARR